VANRHRPTRPPVVLIIDDHEWSTRSLESILAPNGYAVMRAYTGSKGLDRARSHRPDLVIIDVNLPDASGLDVCRALRADPHFGPSNPILITSPERATRPQRLEALRAGAWDFLSYPADAEELLLRLGAYVGAKLEADRLRDATLVDEDTGLYNLRGIERRARELGSLAYRDRTGLACVVVAPASADVDERDVADTVARLARGLQDTARVSDVIGRTGRNEFVVVAPGTGRTGVERLAARIAAALEAADDKVGMRVLAGYDAIENVREAAMAPSDLILNATGALRTAKTAANGGDAGWAQRFAPGSPTTH